MYAFVPITAFAGIFKRTVIKWVSEKIKKFESQYALLGNGEAVANYIPRTPPVVPIEVSIIPQGIGSKIETICCKDPKQMLAGLVKSEAGSVMVDFEGYRYFIKYSPDKS
mgnify:CR=1 FL=1